MRLKADRKGVERVVKQRLVLPPPHALHTHWAAYAMRRNSVHTDRCNMEGLRRLLPQMEPSVALDPRTSSGIGIESSTESS